MHYISNNSKIKPCLYSLYSIITNVNKEFTDFIGFTRDELIGKSLKDIGTMIRINSQIHIETISTQYTGYIFTKLLEVREVEISVFFDYEANEKVYIFVEKHNSRLADKLIFVEQMFIDNITGVAVYSVPDLVLLKINQNYLDFLDPPFNKERISIGRTHREIVTGFVGTQAEIYWETVLQTQKTCYIKEHQFDNLAIGITYWDSTITPIFVSGEMKYIFATTTAVTDRVLKNKDIETQHKIIQKQKEQLEKEFEEKLVDKVISEKNLQLNAVLDYMTEGVIVTDINGDFIIANKIALQMYGLSSLDEYINFPKIIGDFELLSLEGRPIPLADHAVSKALGGEVFTNYEVMVRRKETDLKFIANYGGAPIYDESGKTIMAVITFRDVTEHKMMEAEIKKQQEQLLKAEKEKGKAISKTLKSQEEFVANISHELKTPLNVIFAAAQLFEMYCSNGSLDEKKSSIIKYIHSIKQNSYKLSKLINNIVDSSKIEAGFFKLHLSNNNIVEVVEDIVISVINLIESKGLSIVFDSDIEEKIIACDPEKMERVILNLISNAMKFSHSGGGILVAITDNNEFVAISVEDNGIGIKSEDLDMIFDRFKQVDKSRTRNVEGTGIGLCLVKSIVELHGGGISVESKWGKGSKFTVFIPTQKVKKENKLFQSNMKDRSESISVEFSDII